MAKPRFFIDNIDLNKIPVIQNEIGVYYWNGSRYFTPLLSAFNTSTPPRGYKKYGPKSGQAKPAGSHSSTNTGGVNVRKQLSIDFKAPKLQESVLTSSVDWKLEGVYGTGKNKFAIWTTGASVLGVKRWKFFTVHVKGLPKVGTVVKAGKPMCKVYYDHFHLYILRFGLPYALRNMVLSKA